ncbi:MAG TPA: hypothetical protein VE221_04105 [Sphingomicrobium sp.]|nr:hypothetical protein [Sphingomicrobium sp.]
MKKFLIGPALLGAGYAGGSYYGADAEQVVHKAPDEVRDAIEEAASDRSGTMDLEGGKPVPYETKVERTDDGGLTVRLTMDGRQAAVTNVAFLPQDGGKDTLIAVKIHTDHAVLRDTLAGTSRARLAYAPDWMLNLTAHPLLSQIAQQIEAGDAVADPMQGVQSEADREAALSPDKQKQLQEWRQYDASRPTTDPDADAKRFLNGGQ